MSSIFVILRCFIIGSIVGMHPDDHGDHSNQHYRHGFKSEKTYRLINIPLLKDAILTSNREQIVKALLNFAAESLLPGALKKAQFSPKFSRWVLKIWYVRFMFVLNMKEFMDNDSVCASAQHCTPKHITQTPIHIH